MKLPGEFVVGILLLAGAGRAGPDYALPKQKKAVVLSLDYRGGYGPRRKSNDPHVSILRDGTVRVPDLWGGGKPVEDRLSPQELQSLLRFVLAEHHLLEWDAGRVAKKIRATGRDAPQIADASETVVTVTLEGKSLSAKWYALRLVAAQYPEVPELQDLAAIQGRIESLANVARAGGKKEARKYLLLANAELKKIHPKLDPFGLEDLAAAGPDQKGGRFLRFRRTTRPGHYAMVDVRVPARGAPRFAVDAK